MSLSLKIQDSNSVSGHIAGVSGHIAGVSGHIAGVSVAYSGCVGGI